MTPRRQAIALAVASLLGLLALPGCRSADPACAGITAAQAAPTDAQYRAMTPTERSDAARRFNDLARRCGWEP